MAKWRCWRQIACVTLFFAMLTVAMTWPLAAKMGTAIAGTKRDGFYYLWLIEWVRKSLLEWRHLSLQVPLLNYPDGWNLAYAEMTPAMVLTALPFSVIGGATLGYNVAVLASFVLSGLGVYLWTYRLTKRVGASLIAGTIFAFTPYRIARWYSGHLNLMGTQWLPFWFMSLDSLLRARSWSWRWIVATALSLVLAAFSSMYYLLMSLVVSAVYLAGYLLLTRCKRALDLRLWMQLATCALLALPLLALSVAPYVTLARAGNLYERSLLEAMRWCASPTSFVTLPPTHLVRGGALLSANGQAYGELVIYIGAVAVVLAMLAVVGRRAGRNSETPVPLLLLATLCALILALGTNLHWLGESVVVRVPGALRPYVLQPRLRLWLPGYLLFRYVPFYAAMRVWMRYVVYAVCFLSVLAGIGAAGLLHRFHGRMRMAIGALLLLLVLADQYPGIQPYAQVQGRPVDEWLAQQPGMGAVVQLPFELAWAGDQTYYTLIHGKPFIGAHIAYPTPQYLRIAPILGRFPDEDSVALLQELGVQWVVVDFKSYREWDQVCLEAQSLGMRLRATLGDQVVFELPPRDASGPLAKRTDSAFGFVPRRAPWITDYSLLREGWLGEEQHPCVLGDVNGDKKADLVCFSEGGTYALLSTGERFRGLERWIRGFGARAGGWTSQDQYPRLLGDVNGDGRADVVGFGRDGTYVSLSTGKRFALPKLWIRNYSVYAGGWGSQNLYPRMLADVNGDGKADIVGFGRTGAFVSLSTGSGFAPARLWVQDYGAAGGEWPNQDARPRLVGDVDGDGRADVVGFGRGGTYVSLSTGSSFLDPRLWTREYGVVVGGWTSQGRNPRLLGDVNGDGKADIVGFGNGGALVSLSTGREFEPAEPGVRSFGAGAGGWVSQEQYPRMLADVNGDGKAEIVGLGAEGAFVAQYER